MTHFNGLTGVRSWILLAAATLALGVIVNLTTDHGGRRATGRSAARRCGERRSRPRNIITARIYAKAQIAEEVVAGRVTLLQAAACFRVLDQLPPACPELFCRFTYPGASEEEHCCRAVILWAQGAAEVRDPYLGAIVGAELEAELTELLHSGPLDLPEVEADSLLDVCDRM
jgi:hypothetical protein